MRQLYGLTDVDEPDVAGVPQHVVFAEIGVNDARGFVHRLHHVDGLRVR